MNNCEMDTLEKVNDACLMDAWKKANDALELYLTCDANTPKQTEEEMNREVEEINKWLAENPDAIKNIHEAFKEKRKKSNRHS